MGNGGKVTGIFEGIRQNAGLRRRRRTALRQDVAKDGGLKPFVPPKPATEGEVAQLVMRCARHVVIKVGKARGRVIGEARGDAITSGHRRAAAEIVIGVICEQAHAGSRAILANLSEAARYVIDIVDIERAAAAYGNYRFG
jgi:hypothetical protein